MKKQPKPKVDVTKQVARIEYMELGALRKFPKNPKAHDAPGLRAAFKDRGFVTPLMVDETSGLLTEGHGRLELLEEMRAAGDAPPARISVSPAGKWHVPVVRGIGFENQAQAKRHLVGANRIGADLWDNRLLADMLASLGKDDAALLGTGFNPSDLVMFANLASKSLGQGVGSGRLAEQFLVPPFSVLDARQGYWQERKRAWLDLGIKSELGRVAPTGGSPMPHARAGYTADLKARSQQRVAPGGSARPAMKLGGDGKTRRGDGAGKELAASGKTPARTFGQDLMRGEHQVGAAGDVDAADADAPTGTSIFDPVLCELAYLWFSPPGGAVLDPFAGGSVRGIVAGVLGRSYVGVDLRGEQVLANRAQLKAVRTTKKPKWFEGDSRKLPALVSGKFDFMLTCPPYGDLEVYSDEPADISNMDYAAFLVALRAILGHAVGMLKPNRFACVVVGDFRDDNGFYRNFVSDTIRAMEDAGARLYNEAILVTAVGSLSIRVGRQFSAARKLGKTHQNVLVFVKGDPKKATEACGTVEINTEVLGDPEGVEL